MPTLLLWAEDDVALGRQPTLGLDKWAPDLELHHIRHCGHWVQNVAPEQVNERIGAILRRSRQELESMPTRTSDWVVAPSGKTRLGET